MSPKFVISNQSAVPSLPETPVYASVIRKSAAAKAALAMKPAVTAIAIIFRIASAPSPMFSNGPRRRPHGRRGLQQ